MKKTTAVKLGTNKPADETVNETAAAAPAKPSKPASPPPSVEDHSEQVEHHEDAAPAATSHAVAPVAPSTAVASRPSSGGMLASSPQVIEDDGFNDLDDQIGFGSFPILILDKSEFTINDDSLGAQVDVILQQSRKKHLYKEGGKEQSDYVVYSYDEPKNADGSRKSFDEINDTGGKPLSATFAEWAEDGVDISAIEHKQYSEAVALVLSEGKYRGQLVLLSVPPASIKRFAGYRAELKAVRRCPIKEAVTRLCLGNKVKMDKITFVPWNFKFVRRATEADLAVTIEEEAGEE